MYIIPFHCNATNTHCHELVFNSQLLNYCSHKRRSSFLSAMLARLQFTKKCWFTGQQIIEDLSLA